MKPILIIIIILISSVINAQEDIKWEWAKQMGGKHDDYGYSIITDNNNNIIFAGVMFDDTINFNDTSLYIVSPAVFISKCDSNLSNMIWLNYISYHGITSIYNVNLTSDSEDNLYLCFTFSGEIYIEEDTLFSGPTNTIIAKYNADGEMTKYKWFKSGCYIPTQCITSDSYNNIYIAGIFNDTAYFDNEILISEIYDIFLVKLNSDMEVIWARQTTSESYGGRIANSVITDNFNNVYITGAFTDTTYFTDDTLITSYQDEIFIAKYDSAGNYIWAKTAGGTKDDSGEGIIVDKNNNVYVTGAFYSDTAIFNDTSIISAGGYDIFIAKYNYNGDFIWVRRAGGIGPDIPNYMTIDNNDNIYITGGFYESLYFDTDTLYANFYEDIFIAKYNTNGDFIWAKQATGIYSGNSRCVYSDKNNNIYITGIFTFSAYFDDDTLISDDFDFDGYSDIFIAKIKSYNNNPDTTDTTDTIISYFKIYPNPTYGNLFIELFPFDHTELTLDIYNIHGQLVLRKTISDSFEEIDLSKNSSGLYFVKLYNSEFVETVKIIIY